MHEIPLTVGAGHASHAESGAFRVSRDRLHLLAPPEPPGKACRQVVGRRAAQDCPGLITGVVWTTGQRLSRSRMCDKPFLDMRHLKGRWGAAAAPREQGVRRAASHDAALLRHLDPPRPRAWRRRVDSRRPCRTDPTRLACQSCPMVAVDGNHRIEPVGSTHALWSDVAAPMPNDARCRVGTAERASTSGACE